MTYIKKVVMHGFKSFARKTEIPLENAMNVIVGPNGSGKSNVTDALCFVLGRLSIKSIRAAKAANLLFSGNKTYKGSMEASVELVFDNQDKTFTVDSSEVNIKRTVRKNGQSVYKINNETKTRQELLELLAQAGIDPNGFNIVLQGEIQSLVKATPEERRKIIEEVAGISIYETRKQKSLRELEKTEEKLKEISAVLKERNNYLKNLDKERQEAMNHKKLEETINKCKATILSRNIKEKEKEITEIKDIINDHQEKIERIKKQINEENLSIEKIQKEITKVNKQIQSSTSDEIGIVHNEISTLRAELAGLNVRKENHKNRVEQGTEKIEVTKRKLDDLEEEISNIKVKSPKIKEQRERQKILQEKFDELENKRRKFYILKSDLSTLENQKSEKEKSLIESKKEIQLIEKTISSLFDEIKYAKSLTEVKRLEEETKNKLEEIKKEIFNLEKKILERERENAVIETDIKREEKLREEIEKLQNCPICKQVVGQDHKHKISTTSIKKISFSKEELEKNIQTKKEDEEKISTLRNIQTKIRVKLNEIEIDKIKLINAEEKKDQIKKITETQEKEEKERENLNEKINYLKKDFNKLKDIESEYDYARLKLQELSFKDIDVDTEVTVKQREIGRLANELKAAKRDVDDSGIEFKKINLIMETKEGFLDKKEIEEKELYEKSQRFFEERNKLQDREKALETNVIGFQHTIRNFEDKINNGRIQRAQLDAQIDSLKVEIAEFKDAEILNIPLEQVREKLQSAQFRISKLGNVNMRALEVFDKVKEKVQEIQGRVETIEKEKEQIISIITEIDKKKKKSFMVALVAVNNFFTRNFKQLSRKGEVFLELENQKEPFQGGLNILVKASRGKYFDIASLSGGEKTIVALSLIFAIQEYNPYCFYIFDEIDAALDKHNSELLAALIKKYMTTGQYIIITHNDTLITEATNLYGVSMQENISKIVSLKV